MKIVLDSNVLLVAIGKRSKYKPIWNGFIDGKFQLIISEDILHEYEEILLLHSAPGAAELVLEAFNESPDIIFKRIYYSWNAIPRDPDDNKFFDVAVAGNADYPVQLDNPLGGIIYGREEIVDLYRGIFDSKSEVWVEFNSIIAFEGEDIITFAGRETGEFSKNGETLPLQIRTSRILGYIASEDRWFLIHHHGSLTTLDCFPLTSMR